MLQQRRDRLLDQRVRELLRARGRADPRERILCAAEALFATKGFENTSTRKITVSAGVNIAQLHDYFGTKAALTEELFFRLVAHATETRLSQLSAYLSATQAAQEPVRVVPLVECFVRPYVDPGQTTA